MDRRTTLQWMLATAWSTPLLANRALAGLAGVAPPPAAAKGYGSDPDLTKAYQPGELWPLTFTAPQRRTATALSDLIIPADGQSPSASSVGVIDFIDEWISAPYPRFRKDRKAILEGLAWLEAQSARRFQKDFASLDEAGMRAICDEICYLPNCKPDRRTAARFFARYRDLTTGGFYTTPQGRQDLNYIGNTPRKSWDGPPLEALKKAGLA